MTLARKMYTINGSGKGEKTNTSLINVGDIVKNSPIPPQTPYNDLLVADLVNFLLVTISPLFKS